ncbi:MAG TPA: hypothetical protein PKA28_10820 [Methylomusa anaerophila]|uniref:Uncharacterized protein n=1 Tax=Methylomusa anaerophila TaxID=1930071 RepID=A0A348AJ05_9FIRM|nr:hypothetical protein [Methylomusa anaerophila]BBB91053.1 hypothetical protein MAMMFC1_01721 [Methylomusa anaerophila]HML88927.1 hypothetical protein [Methylomusa anaerophila]
MEKTSPDGNKPEQLIYIGPNIPGGALHRYQVYKGGIPEHLTNTIEKCPAIRGLFVPVEQFATAEQALSSVGSAEHTLFQAIVDYLKKGG